MKLPAALTGLDRALVVAAAGSGSTPTHITDAAAAAKTGLRRLAHRVQMPDGELGARCKDCERSREIERQATELHRVTEGPHHLVDKHSADTTGRWFR